MCVQRVGGCMGDEDKVIDDIYRECKVLVGYSELGDPDHGVLEVCVDVPAVPPFGDGPIGREEPPPPVSHCERFGPLGSTGYVYEGGFTFSGMGMIGCGPIVVDTPGAGFT